MSSSAKPWASRTPSWPLSTTTRGSSPSSSRLSLPGSTRPWGCPSSGRRRTTARPSISPAAAWPIPGAWGKPSGWRRTSARPVLERGPDLPVRIPLLDGLALLVLAFAAGQGELDLDLAPVADEDARRDESEAALLRLAGQALDLAPVEQELALAERVMVEDVGRFVGADMALDQEHLARADLGVALLERDPAGPDRFHLAPDEGQAGFEGLEDDVIVRDRFVD